VPPAPDPEDSRRVSFAPNAGALPSLRRSQRVRNKPKRFVPEDFVGTYSQLLAKNLVAHSARVQYASAHSRVDVEYIAFLLTNWETGCIGAFLPHNMSSFKSVRGLDPDAPTFTQAMQSAQIKYWIDAIKIELSEL
jgi:hypothetical protein